jgi:hypothetical protein
MSSSVRDFGAGSDDRGRVRELERALALENPDRRRVQDGREQPNDFERVHGVLAGGAPTGEERLQRLGGEMDHVVAVKATDPAALHRMGQRMEHAELHGSV